MKIAIIGISGRFPGADNVEVFWRNLSCGIDSIVQIPKHRWDKDEIYDSDAKNLLNQ
ncbi:beta-ketoacyl synthase N-terminal-like domain-containing protein [Bacillus cereus]